MFTGLFRTFRIRAVLLISIAHLVSPHAFASNPIIEQPLSTRIRSLFWNATQNSREFLSRKLHDLMSKSQVSTDQSIGLGNGLLVGGRVRLAVDTSKYPSLYSRTDTFEIHGGLDVGDDHLRFKPDAALRVSYGRLHNTVRGAVTDELGFMLDGIPWAPSDLIGNSPKMREGHVVRLELVTNPYQFNLGHVFDVGLPLSFGGGHGLQMLDRLEVYRLSPYVVTTLGLPAGTWVRIRHVNRNGHTSSASARLRPASLTSVDLLDRLLPCDANRSAGSSDSILPFLDDQLDMDVVDLTLNLDSNEGQQAYSKIISRFLHGMFSEELSAGRWRDRLNRLLGWHSDQLLINEDNGAIAGVEDKVIVNFQGTGGAYTFNRAFRTRCIVASGRWSEDLSFTQLHPANNGDQSYDITSMVQTSTGRFFGNPGSKTMNVKMMKPAVGTTTGAPSVRVSFTFNLEDDDRNQATRILRTMNLGIPDSVLNERKRLTGTVEMILNSQNLQELAARNTLSEDITSLLAQTQSSSRQMILRIPWPRFVRSLLVRTGLIDASSPDLIAQSIHALAQGQINRELADQLQQQVDFPAVLLSLKSKLTSHVELTVSMKTPEGAPYLIPAATETPVETSETWQIYNTIDAISSHLSTDQFDADMMLQGRPNG